MGAADKARNSAQQAKGRLQEDAGRATGNRRLRRKGRTNQLTARVKQTGERLKDKLGGRR